MAAEEKSYKRKNLKVGEEGLLVKRSGLEAERVGDIVDLGGTLLKCILGILSRGVGTCEVLSVLQAQ